MVMLGDGSDISVGVAVLAGGDGAWPQLGGWLEQRAAQVLQEPQAVGGHSQAAPAAGGPVEDSPSATATEVRDQLSMRFEVLLPASERASAAVAAGG